MAARRRQKLGDLVPYFSGRPVFRSFKPSRAERFDVLKRPFVFPYDPGRSPPGKALALEASEAAKKHRDAMLPLLRQWAGLPSDGRLSPGQVKVLLYTVLMVYVPAFGEVELVPAKRTRGRPASGLTAGQKAAIDKAFAAGKSVRGECLRLAGDDTKKADALAAAWRRATK